MNRSRIAQSIEVLASIVLALGPAPLSGFHDGGVATCAGCHLVHDDEPGPPTVSGLLVANSASEVCLGCHESSLGEVLGTDPLLPPPERGAGNFVFLTEDNLNDSPDGATNVLPGDAAGHNLDASGFGLFPDSRYSTAPGGTFPSARLGCTSCHDPHGRPGLRMLNGAGEVQAGLFVFTAPAPTGAGAPITGSTSESPSLHSSYRSGVSAWCGNCHGDYHSGPGSSFRHPIDRTLSASVRSQYDDYDGVLNPTGGSPSTSYLPEVPFEDPGASPTSASGPSTSSRIMCLTCHRAHATSGPAAGRWDFNVSTLGEDGDVSLSYPIPNPYADDEQPPLCWKCHRGGPPGPPGG